jgi:hypothetical protein
MSKYYPGVRLEALAETTKKRNKKNLSLDNRWE